MRKICLNEVEILIIDKNEKLTVKTLLYSKMVLRYIGNNTYKVYKDKTGKLLNNGIIGSKT